MEKFCCGGCGARVFYENSRCLTCQAELGFVPGDRSIATFGPPGENRAQKRLDGGGMFRRCANRATAGACNWMIRHERPETFCMSCRLNRTIPDLTRPQNQEAWLKLETAKRRLLYGLLALGLPVESKKENPARGLAFDFLEERAAGGKIFTGHSGGLITINLEEADDAARERARLRMGEMYRTLLGHFRHEIGHYYWDLLVRDTPRVDVFRQVFGDERVDYAAALESHYQKGAPPNWWTRHVSAYAASHPWEDWAETWAHYLHILDTLDTAAAEGLMMRNGDGHDRIDRPIGRSFGEVAEEWKGVRLLLNGLNRSMGMPDPYPFVLSEVVIGKLSLIHDWLAERRVP